METFKIIGETKTDVFSFYTDIDTARYPLNAKLIDINNSLHIKNLPYNRSKLYIQYAIFSAMFQHFLFGAIYGIVGKHALRIMDKPLWRTYVESDVIMICTDEVDIVNGSALKYSPIYISWLARVLKKPVVFYGNGTTRFTSELWLWRLRSKRLWRVFAKHLLQNVDLITVREEGTYQYFKELTEGKTSINLTAEPAFLLQPASPDRSKAIMVKEGITENSRPLIGVAMTYDVLSSAFGTKLSSEEKYEKAVKEIACFVDMLTDKLSATIVFIPHSIEPNGYRDDRLVSKDIYSEMSNKPMARLITTEYSAEELKALIGQLDIFISCRVHAAIGAIGMNTPVCLLARSWDRRAYNIVGKMAKQHQWIFNIEELDAEKLFFTANGLLSASEATRKSLLSTMDVIKKHAILNGILLKKLLTSRQKKD